MGRKAWGVAVQLYGLSRDGDGGIGDTTALRSFLKGAAGRGADAIALSPTHSLFTADGTRYSPYSPSNRLFLNPLYADPADALPGIHVSGEMDMMGASLIDWPRASAAKFAALRAVFDRISEGPLPDFDKFVREGGQRLREHALFEALQAPSNDRIAADWHKWPAAWKSVEGAEVSCRPGYARNPLSPFPAVACGPLLRPGSLGCCQPWNAHWLDRRHGGWIGRLWQSCLEPPIRSPKRSQHRGAARPHHAGGARLGACGLFT